ncbi:MAG: VanZ family protein [Pseudomonadota bacterium]
MSGNNRHYDASLTLPILAYCGLIFFLSSLSKLPDSVTLIPDKLGHIALYSGLGFLTARYWIVGHGVGATRAIGWTVVCCLVYGISDEFHQYFVPGRESEIGDVVADVIGGFIGSASCLIARSSGLPGYVSRWFGTRERDDGPRLGS